MGNCDKVNPADVDEFSFLGDDRVHRYTVNDEIVEINKFKKALEELGKTRF